MPPPEQLLALAIVVVVAFFVGAGLLRVATRRIRPNPKFHEDGTSRVAPGTRGITKTRIGSADGVVLVENEQWSAIADRDVSIEPGTRVRVVSQDGLILVVEPESPGDRWPKEA